MTPTDVEAARRLYEEAEDRWAQHWEVCRSKHVAFCLACEQWEHASIDAFKAYRTAANIEAGLTAVTTSE